MTDEKYIFNETERERKRTARGVHNKRSHAGRGGRVKTPSDYLSRKERNKMNGDVNIYKLNEPMSWKTFKMMPDDIQSQYLNGIISKYDPDAIALARMFKTTPETVRKKMKELGIKPKKGGYQDPNRNDAFFTWLHGISAESGGAVESAVEPGKVEEVKTIAELPGRKFAPLSGHMTLCGTPAEIGETIATFLGNECIKCEVTWEVV